MSVAVGVPIILLLVLLEGFFSGSELALVSADKVAIRAQHKKGGRSLRLLANFLEAPERILTTTLIGTNLCVVTNSTVLALMLREAFERAGRPEPNVELYTVVLLTPLVLLFAELIPKSVFRRHAETIAPVVIQPLSFLSTLLLPVVALVRLMTATLLRAVGAEGEGFMAVSRDELRLLLERRKSETIEAGERRIIRRIFDFHETTAKEVMRPLIDVVGVEEETTLEEALVLFSDTGYSRLPVFQDRVDNIVGVLHAMDLLHSDDPHGTVGTLKRSVTYAPAAQRVELLLEDLQGRRHGVAIVVDEYGGAEGMVTIEDILEEIVGEIEDEHDVPAADILQRGDGVWDVSARVEIDRLNETLAVDLPEGDYETLAGFLLERWGRIPAEGETLDTERAQLRVLRASSRAIEAVRIELQQPEGIPGAPQADP